MHFCQNYSAQDEAQDSLNLVTNGLDWEREKLEKSTAAL